MCNWQSEQLAATVNMTSVQLQFVKNLLDISSVHAEFLEGQEPQSLLGKQAEKENL